MKRIGVFFFGILMLGITARAQQAAGRLFALPGPDRTLLYVQGLLAQVQPTDASVSFLPEGDRFTIHRADGNTDHFRQIGVVTFPASGAELKKRLDPVLLTDMMNQLQVRSPQDARDLLLRVGPDTLGLLVLVPEIQQAIGFTYIDEGRDSKIASRYRVEHEKAGQALRQETVSISGTLPDYPGKFELKAYQVLDSAVAGTWYCESFANDGLPLFATIYRRDSHHGAFQAIDQQLVLNDGQLAGVEVAFSEQIEPGNHLAYYIQLEDLAGNKGGVSDTLFAFGFAYGRIAGIANLQVQDTLDGLLLSWDPLPHEAVYSAIQLLKSRELGADYVVVDTIPATDTHYFDRQVIPASSYYYKVRPLTYDFSGAQPVTFAEANGYTRAADSASRPGVPEDLQAFHVVEGVRLSWQHGDELDLFGYYVLRGTSSKNMEIISDPVQDTVFIDSLIAPGFSGQLHYALQVVNLSQQYSDTSRTVSVSVAQPVVLTPPGGLQARRTLDGVALHWDHVMERDDQVTGYVLYRRTVGDEFYEPIDGGEAFRLPFHTDSNALAASAYEYAVTSTDAWGNQSILSPVSAIEADPSNGLAPPSQLYLRNLSAGIEIAWPVPVGGDGQSYFVYRRDAGQPAEFKLIGKVDPADVYIDRDVKSEVLYEYTVGIAADRSASHSSASSSIRRQQ